MMDGQTYGYMKQRVEQFEKLNKQVQYLQESIHKLDNIVENPNPGEAGKIELYIQDKKSNSIFSTSYCTTLRDEIFEELALPIRDALLKILDRKREELDKI